MNKKLVAATIALLMTLNTILIAVPANAIIDPLPVFNNASGVPFSQQTITAPDGTGVPTTGLTPGHEVFVMFDKEVADADLGATLYPFGAVTGPPAGTEMYARTAPVPPWPAGQYIPGDAIYVDLPGVGAGVVSVDDVRKSPVTASAVTGAQTYAAGTNVTAGDADLGTPLFFFPTYVMHTAVSAAAAAVGFNWTTDGIYIRDASNIVQGFVRVGPGDIRGKYPSVTVTLAGTGITAKYAAWTKVYSPVFDYQKAIYNDIGPGNVCFVGAGDNRSRNVVIPQVRYATGSAVLFGSQDQLKIAATSSFNLAVPATYEAFVDLNGNAAWDAGEPIYSVPGPWCASGTCPLVGGETRLSYVTGVDAATVLPFYYQPTTVVAAGDLDLAAAPQLTQFPTGQSYYDADGNGAYSYGEWIYNQAANAVAPIFPLAAPFTTRASAVDWTDKGMARTGRLKDLLPAAWATDWPNVVGYGAGSIVAAGDADVGRRLTTFAATDKHTGAGLYVSGELIYRDNVADNIISVGDTREVIVSSGLARAYTGWPVAWAATAAPFYIPGTNVLATDADGFGIALTPFAATEMYYDPFNDGAYLGSDLVAVGGVSSPGPGLTSGYAAPFPVAPGLSAGVQIPFTVPCAPFGNHVVMITTDEPPTPMLGGAFLNAGWQNLAPIPVGTTLPFESLPWYVGPLPDWDTTSFDTPAVIPAVAQAGPAFFAVTSKVCALQMSPGAYAHTLGTPAGIVELDYPKGAIVQNSTGDISLSITLCSEVSSIAIYIPPEFTFLQSDTTSVWTSITNDYSRISMDKLGSNDAIGPSWWSVRITNYTVPGNYAVRLFNVRAPEVCGRYFVKVFIDGRSIGAENFPTIVVKGGLYPAYISGRVLNANNGQYGEPVGVSGKVVAEGKTALGEAVQAQAYFDASANGAYTIYGLAAGTYNLTASAAGFVPETLDRTVSVNAGQSLEGVDIYVYPSATISGTICSKCGVGAIPWGNAASHRISMEILDSNLQSKAWLATNTTIIDPSQAYYSFSFNGLIELDGHVPQDYADYVSGLAPGDYYLKAYVNGYLQRDVVAVHVYEYSRTISVPFDLWRSSQFSVTVHFVDVTGSASPTPKDGTLTLEAYGLDGGIEGYNRTSVLKGSTNSAMMITGKNYGLPSGTYFIKATFPGYSQAFYPQATLGEGCSTTSLSFDMVRSGLLYITLRSVNWQTPPQSVPWGYPNATIRIEAIGSEQVYSGTAMQNTTISEPPYVVFANITDLPPDTYIIRAYTVGYVQTKDYHVSMSFGGMSDIQIDLVEATRLNVTLTFRKEGLVAPIDTCARCNSIQVPVRIEVYDSLGVLTGANITHIPANADSSSIEVVGFRDYAGNPCVRWVNYYDTTDGEDQKDYGFPPGTYTVYGWVPGYAQAQTMTFSTTLSTTNETVDLYFDRLAHVNGTVGGLDMYDNLIPLSWATVTAYGPTLTATSSLDGVYEMWIVDGTYTLGVSYPGYETQGVEIQVSMAWETPVDFNLTPTGTTTPELPTAELMSAVLLVVACASLRRRPPAS